MFMAKLASLANRIQNHFKWRRIGVYLISLRIVLETKNKSRVHSFRLRNLRHIFFIRLWSSESCSQKSELSSTSDKGSEPEGSVVDVGVGHEPSRRSGLVKVIRSVISRECFGTDRGVFIGVELIVVGSSDGGGASIT
jgi:hypothetical protein